MSRVAEVRNSALLLVIVAVGLLDGLWMNHMPLWRQALYLVLALVAYLDGRYLPVRRAWPVFAGGGIAGLAAGVQGSEDAVGPLGVLTVFVVLPWLAGRYLRQRAELIAVSGQRIADLERERAYVAERARLRERERIAADLHDALGHELALVALRAGALELDTTMPDGQRNAAADLRRAAVTATDRLRQTLGLLRADAPSPATPPDEPIDELLRRVRAAGMTVTLDRTGAGGPLPPLVDRAVHRVAQEALTNAARHAPGAPVAIRVDHGADACTVTITNPLPVPGPAREEGGSGLLSLRERVRLLAGTLDAGPEAKAFTVRARIPLAAGDKETRRVLPADVSMDRASDEETDR